MLKLFKEDYWKIITTQLLSIKKRNEQIHFLEFVSCHKSSTSISLMTHCIEYIRYSFIFSSVHLLRCRPLSSPFILRPPSPPLNKSGAVLRLLLWRRLVASPPSSLLVCLLVSPWRLIILLLLLLLLHIL